MLWICFETPRVDKRMKSFCITLSYVDHPPHLRERIDWRVSLQIAICFNISLYLGKYVGYSVLSLFLEINSTFLHARQLLLLWNQSRRAPIYRLNLFLVFGKSCRGGINLPESLSHE